MAYLLQNAHWFLLLIGALNFFHELGHFLVAKACNVKVLKFSLGFGPRLLGFQRGETEYCISALPLGGYVKMLGEIPGLDIPPEEADRALSSKPLWQRSAVLFAGPGFNFLLAFVVYLVMFSGTQTFGSTQVGLVSVGEAAWEAGIRPGDRIVDIDGNTVADWDDLVEQVAPKAGRKLRVTFERQGENHVVYVTPQARKEANAFREEEIRGKIGVSLQYVKPVLAVVDPDSPAAKAGLQSGDVITKVGDTPVAAWHEVKQAVGELGAGRKVKLQARRGEQLHDYVIEPVAFEETAAAIDPQLLSAADTSSGYTGLVSVDTVISDIDKGTPAQKAGLKVGDRLLRLAIVAPDDTRSERPIGSWMIDLAALSGVVNPQSKFILTVQRGHEVLEHSFQLEARDEIDDLKNSYTRYVFGAKHSNDVMSSYTFKRDVGVWEATQRAVSQVGTDATSIVKGLSMWIRGRLPSDAMGGPIMLFVIAEKSAKRGLDSFMRMMALISVNLGVLNLLPIPVLDGGHLLFFAIEAIKRKPPSMRTREIATMVGLTLLLVLMVWVMTNDVLKFVLG
ncbi:MAG: RIP metalloprotease RseP [Myxococcota bacterium]